MDFLIVCKTTQNNLLKLENYSQELEKNLKIKQNSVMSKNEEDNIDIRIDTITNKFTELSTRVKKQIRTTINETNQLKKKGGNIHVINLRETHILGHSKKLSEVLKKFQNIQYEFRKREKNKIRENFLIACPNATSQQLNDLEDIEKADEILKNAFSLGSQSAKIIIKEAQNRKMKIKNLVSKINILIELLEEIDKFVHENSDVVDKLVLTMENAAEDIQASQKQLESARGYQESRNHIIRLFSYGGAILIGIGIVVLILFINPRGSD